MKELLSIILDLSRELKSVRAYLGVMTKSRVQLLRESWLDGNQVMSVLNISRRTLQQLRNSGQLPYSKINGKLFYKLEDLEKLLESNYMQSKNYKNGNYKKRNSL